MFLAPALALGQTHKIGLTSAPQLLCKMSLILFVARLPSSVLPVGKCTTGQIITTGNFDFLQKVLLQELRHFCTFGWIILSLNPRGNGSQVFIVLPRVYAYIWSFTRSLSPRCNVGKLLVSSDGFRQMGAQTAFRIQNLFFSFKEQKAIFSLKFEPSMHCFHSCWLFHQNHHE